MARQSRNYLSSELPIPGGDLPPSGTSRGPSKEEIRSQVPAPDFDPRIGGIPHPPIPPCELVAVCIRKLTVSRASYLREPLASLSDWDLIFAVNGAPWTWNLGQVDPNTEHRTWFCRFVRLDPYGEIIVSIGGSNSPANFYDQLPAATVFHDSADNWGVGPVHVLLASDSDYEFEIEYTISCARSKGSIIGIDEITTRMLSKSARDALKDNVQRHKFLTSCIGRLERYQMKLKQLNGDTLIFEGPQTVQELLEQIAPIGESKLDFNRKAGKRKR